MNIYDIAEKCGVSIATVSRVLNNNPNVSAATREKILAVIDEANYTPYQRGCIDQFAELSHYITKEK